MSAREIAVNIALGILTLTHSNPQACHATAAALWESKEEPFTQQYCSQEQINSMHKTSIPWSDFPCPPLTACL